jgi:hypothetical protein
MSSKNNLPELQVSQREIMTFKTDMSIVVLRDIVREEGEYAKEGDKGLIIELFQSQTGSNRRDRVWYAKTRMDSGGIKTFRISSIIPEIVN